VEQSDQRKAAAKAAGPAAAAALEFAEELEIPL